MSSKIYDSLDNLRLEIYDALTAVNMTADLLIEKESGGYIFNIGYPSEPSIKEVTNAKIGVAWKPIDSGYKAVVHLLDENGNRIK